MTLQEIIQEIDPILPKAKVLDILREVLGYYRKVSGLSQFMTNYEITTAYSGLATSSAATLTDTDASFDTEGTLIGQTVLNVTDGSEGTITAVTGTVITATLAGGTNNTWAIGDAYTISLVNGIVLPKSVKAVSRVNVGGANVSLNLRWEGEMQTAGEDDDSYSYNIINQTPDFQACRILDSDNTLRFVNNIDSASTLKLYCKKDISTAAITTTYLSSEMNLPNKHFDAICDWCLHRLFLSEKHRDYPSAIYYKNEFKKSFEYATCEMNAHQASKINLEKSGSDRLFKRGVRL